MINWQFFGKCHEYLYKLSGGRFGAKMGWINVVLVSTVGRKSGKVRQAPIACYPYNNALVVSASNSGQEKPPAWYLNMQANPRVTVQYRQETYQAIAEDVPDEERETVWETVVKINHHQGNYLQKVSRKIPLVMLRRV